MNIDSFAGVPLLITAAVGVLLIFSFMIAKLRNTAKPSFVLYLSAGILITGTLYTYFNRQFIYLVFIILITECILFLYSIIIAFSNPQKKEDKKQAKRLAELRQNMDANTVSNEALQAEKARFNRIIDVNKDLIAKASSFFTTENSMEQFLDYCNKLLSEKVEADGCIILMADDFDNLLAVRSFKGTFPPPYKLPDDLPHKPLRVETNMRFAQFPLQDNIFGEIASAGESLLVTDSVKEPRIYQNGPEEFLKCGSYIFVPIKQQEGVAGVIALSRDPDKAKFTQKDLETAEIITDATATAMKPLYSFLNFAEHKKLTQGGDIATKIQKDLIPSKLPVIPGVGIGCFTSPAENVCGDFYDVIVSRKDRISFIVGDVAGKGMNSLTIMLMIRSILRLIVNTPQSAATILNWANRGICNETMKIDHFASIALVNYNSITKQAQVATCGNNTVILYTAASRSIKTISMMTEPMGVEKEIEYTDIDLQLEPGDILVACTDGVIESLDDNGVQYSSAKLEKVIASHAHESAKNISNRVKDDLKKYIGSNQQFDDTSLLVIKVE
ncbi:MAG: SpoIIE family protein phosphatase [Treponema sp.]|uniref:GAF domain-containing SpoIIE family protein phosphatase n=1 Tax=Treponema sp. TaxID=166 RepID=UPI00298D750B|nr:GAF domain-containing SpoIIE family protein phosphatase [Treponema sp.]MCQ2584319.1 SpoIIE family protein phosphatase [Treponema sp.]MCQ2601934.1 SpoIIE family protein phosphatase [Treponema sp.]